MSEAHGKRRYIATHEAAHAVVAIVLGIARNDSSRWQALARLIAEREASERRAA